jgi:MFS family permease
MFVGGRILLGVGGAISLTAAPPLVTECAYPTQRPVVTAMLMPSWPVGALIAALVTWAPYNGKLSTSNWGWRLPSLLQLALPLVQCIVAFFGPESPRWLIDKGRIQEAENFFATFHAAGDKNHPIVAYEMAEIAATIEEEKAQAVGSWLQWFRGKTMVHRLFLCIAVPLMQQLSGNALISFYLPIILDNAGITNSDSQLRINLGLSGWTLICSICGATIVGIFKRRTLFLTGYASMFVVYIAFTAVSAVNAPFVVPGSNTTNKPLSDAIVFLIFLYNMVYQICSPIAFTYTMEICPYSMRSKGSMLYQFSGAIVGFFNNYVNPVAMTKITWKYYIVYVVWLAVQFTIVFFLFPETYGRDLEEVNKAFHDNLISGREAMEKAHMTINVNVEKQLVTHEEV